MKNPIIVIAVYMIISLHVYGQTGIASRLIAIGHSVYTGSAFQLADTTYYTYSGSRGYDSRTGGWKYDVCIIQNYDTLLGTYKNYTMYNQGFDAYDKDTEFLAQDWYVGAWANSGKSKYHYNTDNYADTEINFNVDLSSGLWIYNRMIITTYNAANQPTLTQTFTWNYTTNTWYNSSDVYYTYNSSGDLIIDNRDSTTRHLYTYDASHNLVQWQRQDWNYSDSTWMNASMFINSDFVGNQSQLHTIFTWNGTSGTYDTTDKWHYTFNSFDQVQTYLTESNYTGTGTWQYGDYYRYYYEMYTSGIDKVPADSSNANIYPTPAAGQFNIDIHWQEPQPFSVFIIDMAGRTIDSWHSGAVAQYHTTHATGGIPAANYIVKITGTKNEITKQLTITN